MCKADPLFYINVFCWVFEPRPSVSKIQCLPFITYEFQDDLVKRIVDAIDKGTGLYIEKSRDMGCSFIGCTLFDWLWRFRPFFTALMASDIEENVDKANKPGSLFWKIDFVDKNLPGFLQVDRGRVSQQILNRENGSVIDGTATKRNIARGDRRAAIWLDEFATFDDREQGMGLDVIGSCSNATDCTIFCSTHLGTATGFYKVKEDRVANGSLPAVRLHWTIHPEHSRGLYYDQDGKPRSIWYDKKCLELMHKVRISQELDIDPHGSASQFFDTKYLEQLEKQHGRAPVWRGEVEFDHETGKFKALIPSDHGSLKLWRMPEPGQKFKGEFSVACDPSGGSGANNAIACIVDRDSKEQVGEWADRSTRPERFAALAVALCELFDNAFMIWEQNGSVGQNFGAKVSEIGFCNFYMRRQSDKITNDVTDKPGWWSSEKAKLSIFTSLNDSLRNGAFIIRSAECYKECKEIIYKPNGTVQHVKEKSEDDPAAAGGNHADRVVAVALGNLSLSERPVYKEAEIRRQKQGTFGYRLEQEALAAAREKAEQDCFQFN